MLIVDDQPEIRRALRMVLKASSQPCRILGASEGESALALARSERPDLVLLDIVLPGSGPSGVLVCQELCKDSRTKVVIVSAEASDSIVEACLSLGAIEYIRKPFSVPDLQEKLGVWLGG
ncbi:MAG: response regulator [Gemmatimonadales bacterium]|nr:response regulator [Gemmatimonadales bacterium]